MPLSKTGRNRRRTATLPKQLEGRPSGFYSLRLDVPQCLLSVLGKGHLSIP